MELLRGAEGRRLQQQGRLIKVNRFVSDGEEAAAFQRADIIWAYYPKSYCSSGAMVRAGQASLPVIATREGLVGHTVSMLGMGLTAPENDEDELTLVLVRLGSDAATREKLGKAGFEHFSQYTAEAFGNSIVEQVSKAIQSGKDDDDRIE
jgi:glycosyltransferase involved in cell wall biosynthesis